MPFRPGAPTPMSCVKLKPLRRTCVPTPARALGFIGILAGLGLIAAARGTSPTQGPASPSRPLWTGSRVHGTPDPPLPYMVEPAFPRLTFERPIDVAQPAGLDRLFVAEHTGRIYSFPIDPSVERADLAVDLSQSLKPFDALYAFTFHPRFAENRQVIICYIIGNELPDGTRVSRFRVTDENPPRIDPSSEQVLITWLSGGHNGCSLQFGPDGFLYISTGDATAPSPPDALDTGQNLDDLLSCILRIDVDQRDDARGTAYRIPDANPFRNVPGARPEIWAYGFRNPWRMSFDRATGELWVGDVGWELWELLHRVERGGNYGWSVMEGRQPVRPDAARGPTPIIPPVVEHPHSEAASITGGYAYHGSRLPALKGVYIYGDYQSGLVWGLRSNGREITWQGRLADTGLRLVSFGEDRSGEIYLVEYERTNQLYRLVPNPAQAPTGQFPLKLSDTGLFLDTARLIPTPGVLPYSVNAPAWNDGLHADRWLAVPGEARIRGGGDEPFQFPDGSVLLQTLSDGARRLETRMLHLEDDTWRPYTYVWNAEQTDATLAPAEGLPPDASRPHDVPARSECLLCHNPWVEKRTANFGRQSASPLGMQTTQLNRPAVGSSQNQLEYWRQLGLLEADIADWSKRPRLADPYDPNAPLEARARAYLHVNCSQCHQFNAGGTATIDLAASVPLDQMKAVDANPIQGSFGLDNARIIAPGAPERSVLYYRLAKSGTGRMPRAGSVLVDNEGVRMIGDWIASMGQRSSIPGLELLCNPQTPAVDVNAAVEQMANTPSTALALAHAYTSGSLSEQASLRVRELGKKHSKPEIRELFERFLPAEERVARLGDRFDVEALLALEGDVERGRRWIQSDAGANCRTCHRLEGEGGEVGPELVHLQKKYDRRALLRELIEPSRSIESAYAAHLVATADGQIQVGRLVERTAQTLVLRDAKNTRIEIPVGTIEQESTQTTSLMPEGLLRDLTAQEAADLIAYLLSLK